MTTTHTAASLAALHADDPRKLDALAHEAVFGERTEEIQGRNGAYLIAVGVGTLPNYSASLDAAALLEARLAERDMEGNYGAALMDVLDKEFHPSIFYIATATARDRTIAAVLAAQEAK